ncbi:ABC transporter substrate-binding protein [Streptomyces parvus]|uniref:ABC transporter substrate-binding protein n=1 Tax=unclassified Streptomyces TaxID=2593676 RepID=UPI00158748E4|nr:MULTISPECIES: iron-siderophore ABC transporter substrate-binding protein [unclassified Streptomyces]NUV67324.1 iron-siderophore ABC transporter substrate-binding protein [Streptomyces sp. CAI-121]NUW13442.1 iron-siderophore ABC transporter substrate-binding protein [Streptomyces sp. CAI-68]
MKNQHLTWPVLAAAAALALTACGTTEAPKKESAGDNKAVTVTDSRGKKITLDGPAKRVVGTEWNVVETLVTLGVQPVGVADVKGYTAYDTAAPLTKGVKDIGTRGEPSVATVAGLKPDLIVATTDLSDSAIAQLSKAAPVAVVRSADASRQIDQMVDTVNLIARATGTEDKAKSEIDSFRKAVADGKKKLADAGLDGEKVAFADGWQEGNQVSVRPYVKGSLLSDVNTELGLVDPWKLKGDKAYGLAATDVEGLTKIGDAQFAYIANDADGGDPFAGGLKDNAVWKSLPFVKNDEVHRLPDGIWMFGGTASMREYIDALVGALTA